MGDGNEAENSPPLHPPRGGGSWLLPLAGGGWEGVYFRRREKYGVKNFNR
jgi:hypothetical protein